MKKTLLLIPLVVIVLVGCNSQSSKIGSDDMLGFLLNIEDVYCNQVALIKEYNSASKTEIYKSRMVNGSDVPSQRALAQEMLNKIIINNLEQHIENLKSNPMSNKFSETVRLLGLSYDFFYKFLENDKNLSSYQEFQNVIVDFGSAAQILTTIEGTLKEEYGYLYKDISKAPIGESNLLNIDDICLLSLNVNSN